MSVASSLVTRVLDALPRSIIGRFMLALAVAVLYIRYRLRAYLRENFDSIPLPSLEDHMQECPWLVRLVGGEAVDPAIVIKLYEKMGKPLYFKMRFLWTPVIVSVVKADADMASQYRKALTYKPYQRFLGQQSILFQEGDKARRERNMLNKGFGQQTYRAVHSSMIESSERLRTRMLDESNDLGSCDAENLIARSTLEVIAQGAFGLDVNASENIPYLIALKKMLRIPGNPIALLPGGSTFLEWWYKESLQLVHKLLDRTVSDRILKASAVQSQTQEEGDLLDFVIAASRMVEAGEENMQQSWIRDQVQLLFVGGSDTSSVTMLWAFILMAHHPDIQAKVKSEIDQMWNDVENDSTNEQERAALLYRKVNEGLRYSESFIKETLRVYPPVRHLSRRPDDDQVEFGGIEIKDRKWTTLTYAFYLGHQREEYFPQPQEFRPERFLNGEVDLEAFGAFSRGFRTCLGKNFAMLEMKTILAVVLRGNIKVVPLNKDQKLPVYALAGQIAAPMGKYPIKLVSTTPSL